ncbi:MAG: hypothetical protein K940chlam9_00786 [Chlamydiae bacterium]|nr:hypothetical protein [Chlamydiota bacterium]
MMAGLFTLMSIILGSIYFQKRKLAFVLLLVTIGLCWLMLYYHATSTLQINW